MEDNLDYFLKHNGYIKLPCKIGDTVWAIKRWHVFTQNPIEYKVDEITIDKNGITITVRNKIREETFPAEELDKSLFLTEEDAKLNLNIIDRQLDMEDQELYDNGNDMFWDNEFNRGENDGE